MCCFFFKQKTAYEMRISDWSSDVCSSDLMTAIADLTLRVLNQRPQRQVGNRGHLLETDGFAKHIEHVARDMAEDRLCILHQIAQFGGARPHHRTPAARQYADAEDHERPFGIEPGYRSGRSRQHSLGTSHSIASAKGIIARSGEHAQI